MIRGPLAPLPVFHLAPGSGRPWLELFLSRVAERLSPGPSGDTLLIEQWWDGHDGEVRLLPFSERVVLALETLQEGTPMRWTRRTHDTACTPPTGLVEGWFHFVEGSPRGPLPEMAPKPLRFRAAHSRDETVRQESMPAHGGILTWTPLSVGHRYWAALQTHWTAGADAEVWTTTRGRLAAESSAALDALASSLGSHLRHLGPSDGGSDPRIRRIRPRRRHRTEWDSGARSRWACPRPVPLHPDRVRAVIPFPLPRDPSDDPRLRHTVVLGASGSGKTAMLARLARRALVEGRSVVLFDVHGDLAPQVTTRLPGSAQEHLLGIDVVGAPTSIPGLSVFGPVPVEDREALVAHLVAALKRLSTENGETFWGFRLERLFETFLHLVQEQGGDLVDLWHLLTDPRRREAARLTTGRPEIGQFLEELEGILRRQPEFLWPAASRVAKVVGSPLLTALLAPQERAAEVGDRLREGASVIWRLPMGELGPEGVTFAVTLLLTRVYLEHVRRSAQGGTAEALRVLFVLDEAHLFPSRLLSEIVAEGRKFGLGLVLATQYPARLAPELRDALTGAAGTVYLFRVPWASAIATGAWVGLAPDLAQRVLPSLPAGWAVVSSTGPDAERRLVAMPGGFPADPPSWRHVVQRTADLYGAPVPYPDRSSNRSSTELEEQILLGLVALDAEGQRPTRARLLRWLDVDEPIDPVLGLQVLDGLVQRGWVRTTGEALSLSPAGADRVGLTARTGARPESAEHRGLLVTAMRIFARHHERLEILRQGRFDTRLPDGRVRVLPPRHRQWSPAELAQYLDVRRGSWMWRAFGGRDVYVESEVSGATRRERVERDWSKASDAGASLLVLVGDAGRARSVRRFLGRVGAARSRAVVWTLSTAHGVADGGTAT